MVQDGVSEASASGQDSTDIDQMNALTAATMMEQAEWLENAAREAGAYPKGW